MSELKNVTNLSLIHYYFIGVKVWMRTACKKRCNRWHNDEHPYRNVCHVSVKCLSDCAKLWGKSKKKCEKRKKKKSPQWKKQRTMSALFLQLWSCNHLSLPDSSQYVRLCAPQKQQHKSVVEMVKATLTLGNSVLHICMESDVITLDCMHCGFPVHREVVLNPKPFCNAQQLIAIN